jgi:hypothetical protein
MAQEPEAATEATDPSAAPYDGRAYFTEPYWNAGQ